jgi:hypothetical protein
MPAAAGNIHEEATLYLPRILCLHGGGTNAKIFRAQCRVLRAELGSKFRLCFAEAPFSSQPGPVCIDPISFKDHHPLFNSEKVISTHVI